MLCDFSNRFRNVGNSCGEFSQDQVMANSFLNSNDQSQLEVTKPQALLLVVF